MTRLRCTRNEIAAMIVKNQSRSEVTEPRTDAGSCGRGCGIGGVTNWKRIVMSARVILPRDRSSSGSSKLAPFFWILPVCLSCASEMISLPTAMRASMPSEKCAMYWLPLTWKRSQLRGNASDGTTNMFFADCPIVMFSRLRTSRSSTMRPPWMMPMRKIFGFETDPGCCCLAGAVAMRGSFVFGCRLGFLKLLELERRVRDALEDLRDEVLLQLLPVVVDAGLLIEEERLGLLDLALDADLVLDHVRLLAVRALPDIDLGGGVGGRRRRRVAARGLRERERRREQHWQREDAEERFRCFHGRLPDVTYFAGGAAGAAGGAACGAAGPAPGAAGAAPGAAGAAGAAAAAPGAGAAPPGAPAAPPAAAFLASSAAFFAARAASRSAAFFTRSRRFS